MSRPWLGVLQDRAVTIVFYHLLKALGPILPWNHLKRIQGCHVHTSPCAHAPLDERVLCFGGRFSEATTCHLPWTCRPPRARTPRTKRKSSSVRPTPTPSNTPRKRAVWGSLGCLLFGGRSDDFSLVFGSVDLKVGHGQGKRALYISCN